MPAEQVHHSHFFSLAAACLCLSDIVSDRGTNAHLNHIRLGFVDNKVLRSVLVVEQRRRKEYGGTASSV